MRWPLIPVVLAWLVALSLATPAEAHRLRVFATVEGGSVSGYGFFVGGGRPAGVAVRAETVDGGEVYHGTTDGEGRFTFPTPAEPTALIITLDPGDGHVAATTLEAGRFGPATDATPPAGTSPSPAESGQHQTAGDTAGPGIAPETVIMSREALQVAIDRSVEAAVARQVRPLLESYAAAESRLRFNDVAGGIGMIVGLAGIALWISAKNRLRRESDRRGETG